MAYIEWFDKLAIGINEVDVQHKKLVELINELHDNLRKGSARLIIDQILNELVKYAIYHFDTEEKLMSKYNYPYYSFHKEQHENFKAKINEFLEKKEIKGIISVDLLLFLKDWLVKHIIVVDKKMGSFLSKKGIGSNFF